MKAGFLVVFLIIAIFNINIIPVFAISGHIEKQDTGQQINKELFTGEVEKLDSHDVINLTVSRVLSSGYNLEGDEFFAEVTKDVETEKGIIIPVGTIVHGMIRVIGKPKNNGRDGWVNIDFDYIVTPDGRQIPIQASLSTKPTAVKSAAKTIAHHTGYTLLGGVAGGFFALNALGLGAAVASNGYTLAAGAAVGGAVGLTAAIFKKGNGFIMTPGDEFKIKIDETLEMPVFSKDAFRQEELFLEGLKVDISEVKLEKDPFGAENTISLGLRINNNSPYAFSTFDIALVSDTNQSYFPSPFGDTSLWFKTIEPGDRVIGKLSFSVNDKKAKHWLVFYDRKTKKPLAKYSIDNAKNDLKAQANHKKNKKAKKKIKA